MRTPPSYHAHPPHHTNGRTCTSLPRDQLTGPLNLGKKPEKYPDAVKRRPDPLPGGISNKMMCVHCTLWLPYGSAHDKGVFDIHQEGCTQRQCGNCGLVMENMQFEVHVEGCWAEKIVGGSEGKKMKGEFEGDDDSLLGEKEEAKKDGKVEEGEMAEKEKTSGRAEWDTDYLRQAFGEIE
jgi:hypothetical protein